MYAGYFSQHYTKSHHKLLNTRPDADNGREEFKKSVMAFRAIRNIPDRIGIKLIVNKLNKLNYL